MKRTATLVVFLASVLIASLGHTQEMPQGTVQVNTWCTINEGHTFAEAVEVGRYVDNEWENGPLQIFFRQAIAGPNLPPNGLLRVVYWNNLEHWSRGLAALPSPVGPRAHLNEIMSCDESNRSFFLTRNIGGRGGAYGGGENNVSMSSARACQVKPGNTIEDVYSALAENNAPYREQGDRTTYQLSQRFLGPREGLEMGTGLLIRMVGDTSHGLAARLDMSPKIAGVSEEFPVVNCLDRSLWESHVIHWSLPSEQE